MLRTRAIKSSGRLDGRYADEAIESMSYEIKNSGTQAHEYQVKLFGGGHMFSGKPTRQDANVGEKNIEVARSLIKQHGFFSCAEHLGGNGHRNIFFDIWSGHVWVRHQPPLIRNKKSELLCAL
jgi:chemotaxis protein CheD